MKSGNHFVLSTISKFVLTLIVAATVASSLTVFHRQLVWERVDGDRLFWSTDEAYFVALRIRDGWSGNLLEYGWGYAKALIARSGTLTNRKTWLQVTRITSDGISSTIVPDTDAFPLSMFEGHLFGMYKGVLSKWIDQRFVPVGPEEAERFNRGVTGGQFRDVNGWSSEIGISKREPGTRRYPLVLRGVAADVVVVQNSSLQSVSVQIGNGSPQSLFEVHLDPTFPDRVRYQELFAAGPPVH